MNYLWLLLIVPANWLLAWALSWAYVLWLWKVSGDFKYVCTLEICKRKIPVPVFVLVSEKSWYAQAWAKWGGMACFSIVLISTANPHVKLLRHELQHVRQWFRWGTLFAVLYGFYHLRYGYWLNPFEVEAREAENV